MGLNKCKSYDESDYICQQCSINHMEIHNSCYREVKNMPETHIDKAIKNTLPKSSEAVNHPQHYNQPGRRECIEIMLLKYGPRKTYWFCIMQAEKYEYRAGTKADNPAEQDRGKENWYYDYAEELTRRFPEERFYD